MEAQDERRIAERREANQRSSEGRRIDKVRRIWSHRHSAGGGMAGEDKFDRRGEHPSLFAGFGFTLLRGIRRIDPTRRSSEVRRSFIRRGFDRRATS